MYIYGHEQWYPPSSAFILIMYTYVWLNTIPPISYDLVMVLIWSNSGSHTVTVFSLSFHTDHHVYVGVSWFFHVQNHVYVSLAYHLLIHMCISDYGLLIYIGVQSCYADPCTCMRAYCVLWCCIHLCKLATIYTIYIQFLFLSYPNPCIYARPSIMIHKPIYVWPSVQTHT